MLDDHVKIDCLCRERKEMRDEIIIMQKSMHKVVFAIISVGTAMTALYHSEILSLDESLKGYLILLLIQVEFAFTLFLSSLIANQSVHAGYIAAINKKINNIAGEELSIYDTYISVKHLNSNKSSFFYMILFFIIYLFIIFVFLVYIGFESINSLWMGVLFCFEIIAILGLTIWSFMTRKTVYKDSLEKYGLEIDKTNV